MAFNAIITLVNTIAVNESRTVSKHSIRVKYKRRIKKIEKKLQSSPQMVSLSNWCLYYVIHIFVISTCSEGLKAEIDWTRMIIEKNNIKSNGCKKNICQTHET